MVEKTAFSEPNKAAFFRSLKPFRAKNQYTTDALEDLKKKFRVLSQKTSINQFDFDLPVDAVVTHSSVRWHFV